MWRTGSSGPIKNHPGVSVAFCDGIPLTRMRSAVTSEWNTGATREKTAPAQARHGGGRVSDNLEFYISVSLLHLTKPAMILFFIL